MCGLCWCVWLCLVSVCVSCLCGWFCGWSSWEKMVAKLCVSSLWGPSPDTTIQKVRRPGGLSPAGVGLLILQASTRPPSPSWLCHPLKPSGSWNPTSHHPQLPLWAGRAKLVSQPGLRIPAKELWSLVLPTGELRVLVYGPQASSGHMGTHTPRIWHTQLYNHTVWPRHPDSDVHTQTYNSIPIIHIGPYRPRHKAGCTNTIGWTTTPDA